MDKKQVTLGSFVVIIGLLLLLSNMNIGPVREIAEQWWPVGILVAGLLVLWNDRRNYLWALLVMAVGTLLLMNTLELTEISFGDVVVPMLIVTAGLSLLTGANRKKVLSHTNAEESTTAILGGASTKSSSSDYKGGSANAALGGVELDLSKVIIKKEAVLNVWVLMGGVELRVPENVIVKSRTVNILGGTEDKTQPTASKDAPVLYIDGTVIMGGVEVKR